MIHYRAVLCRVPTSPGIPVSPISIPDDRAIGRLGVVILAIEVLPAGSKVWSKRYPPFDNL
jgi:hypothetical protein